MNNNEKFERHLSKPKSIELINAEGVSDTFFLCPLKYKDFPDLMKVIKVMSKFKDSQDVALVLQSLDEEITQIIQKLAYNSLDQAYPDTPKEQKEALVVSHFWELFPQVIEMSMTSMSEDKVKEMKGKLDNENKLNKEQSPKAEG